MKNIFILSLLFVSSVWAQNMCQPNLERKIETTSLKRTPNYFFKTSPDGRYLYYIADGMNLMLDTKTGEEFRLQGNADPVPSVDGNLLTTLQQTNSGWVISAYEMKEGVPVSNSQPLAQIGGSYQSVGKLNENGKRPVLYYDELVQKVVLVNLYKKNNAYVFEDQYSFVQSDGKDLRLPMMSPDGKRFSALNMNTNQTEIYDILPNGQAKLFKSLPFAGGKAAFSHDGKKITFHLARDISVSQGQIYHDSMYPATLDASTQVRNIYVYDIEKGITQQVTDNKMGNSYFPIFLKDGRVAYINKTLNGPYEIQYSTVPDGIQRSFESVSQCLGVDAETQLDHLAKTWSKLCTSWSVSDDKNGAGIASVLGMSAETCRLVASRSGDLSLLKVCAALEKAELQPVEKKNSAGEHILSTRCLICHGEEKSWFAKNKNKVIESINSKDPKKRMPKGGASLTEQQKKDLVDYLSSFK